MSNLTCSKYMYRSKWVNCFWLIKALPGIVQDGQNYSKNQSQMPLCAHLGQQSKQAVGWFWPLSASIAGGLKRVSILWESVVPTLPMTYLSFQTGWIQLFWVCLSLAALPTLMNNQSVEVMAVVTLSRCLKYTIETVFVSVVFNKNN